MAGQREVIAESLQVQVVNAIQLLSKNLRDDRKKALNDGSNYQQNLALQIGALDRAKRNYEKSYRDAEKAVESFHRADADLNLSRAEVEKQRHNMAMKNQQSDDAKNEYANQLQKTNKLQQQHYEAALPDVFNRLQELDEKRTRGVKEFIKGATDIELSVAPIIARCLEGISKAAESIEEKEDSKKVIERWVLQSENVWFIQFNLLNLLWMILDTNLDLCRQATFSSRIYPKWIRKPQLIPNLAVEL